jgi:hypothetical protein
MTVTRARELLNPKAMNNITLWRKMQGKSLNFLSIVFAAALIHIPLPY